jgi:hypothetical protein
MAIITNVTGAWSDAVTLTDNEFWQVRRGPVFIATDAATAPAAGSGDGLLLSDGDVLALSDGDVVRYRSARPDNTGEIVRRAKV